MKGDLLPIEHHVLRYVAYPRTIWKEGVVVGAHWKAFEPRVKDKNALSVTWIEHFPDAGEVQIANAIRAFRRGYFTDPAMGKGERASFAKGNVGRVHDACEKYKSKIRMVHEPSGLNTGHSAIRRIPRDNVELLSVLANQIFTTMIANNSIPDK